MFKIVIDDAIPFVKGVLDPFCRVEYIDGREIKPVDVEDAHALMVRTRTKCGPELLEGSKVRAIASATIGYDHIDMEWCRERGIEVFTAAGCNARAVLQWLAAVLDYDSRLWGWEPGEKTLGVVGAGNVGSLSAVYGQLWGFRVLCCDPPREKAGLGEPNGKKYVTLQEIASLCDIITFHTPLTRAGGDATYRMAGEGFFRRLQPGTLVLNSARGEVIESGVFKKYIAAGRCGGAIDTWEHEPEIDRQLLAEASLATPHIAGYTAQGKANATAMAVRALAQFFGLPLKGWYPAEILRTAPRRIPWGEMKATIGDYFDIEAQSARLKSDPAAFEQLRTRYNYRQEYF